MVDFEEIEQWRGRDKESKGSNRGSGGDDLITWVLLILNIVMLVILVIVTFLSGVYAAVSHPGDRLLNIIYAAVVYTSPYVLFSALGLALYILRKSRAITYTHSFGVLTLLGLWIYINVLNPEEDVTLGFSLYDTLHDNFVISALTGGAFAVILLMQAYLTVPNEYTQ